MVQENLRDVLFTSRQKFENLPAISFVDSDAITYHEFYKRIVNTALKLKSIGILKGDKVAILSSNSPNWGISYLATIFLGATVVPILNEFSKNEIQFIINHSEAKAVFVSENLKYKIIDNSFELLKYIINIEDFTFNDNSFSEKSALWNSAQIHIEEKSLNILFGIINLSEVAVIIYTSGTTGTSKGVMLTHKNLMSNINSTYQVQKMGPGDRLLSILPLSHAYECTLGFLMPLFKGATIYYLNGPPTTSILLPSLQKIRPTMILSVPLIIEKIYKSKILPSFSIGIAGKLYSIDFFRKFFNYIAGIKLKKTFGGKLHFLGIGGAKLETTTERFLIEAKFPYAIGYGLTETSPLLAAAVPSNTKLSSTGISLPGQKLKLININGETGEGEIVASGDNIMKGYYKDDELTKLSFTSDGWYKTGDLGYFDNNNRLFIKGRLKNMILTSNGENIYPEEIEMVLNKHQLVVDSLVYELKGKLVAQVHLDYEELEKRFDYLKESAIHLQHDMQQFILNTLEEIQVFVNKQVRSFSKLAEVIEQPVPFEKTPTLKIKKYLYIPAQT